MGRVTLWQPAFWLNFCRAGMALVHSLPTQSTPGISRTLHPNILATTVHKMGSSLAIWRCDCISTACKTLEANDAFILWEWFGSWLHEVLSEYCVRLGHLFGIQQVNLQRFNHLCQL